MPPAGPGTLDPCLVGTWRTTEHSESYETEQGPASLTDLDRTMTFTADGTQTITYASSQATVTAEAGALPAVFDGRVVYRTSTSGSTMSFQVVEAEGTVTVLGPDGAPVEENPIEPGTGDVSYTCDGTTLEQTATGYLSSLRAGGLRGLRTRPARGCTTRSCARRRHRRPSPRRSEGSGRPSAGAR